MLYLLIVIDSWYLNNLKNRGCSVDLFLYRFMVTSSNPFSPLLSEPLQGWGLLVFSGEEANRSLSTEVYHVQNKCEVINLEEY
jgi:hypothetical protein